MNALLLLNNAIYAGATETSKHSKPLLIKNLEEDLSEASVLVQTSNIIAHRKSL